LRIPALESIPHFMKDRPFPGEPGEAWVGDSGYILNYPDYAKRSRSRDGQAGPSTSDNYIKVSRGQYWSYNGNKDRVKSVKEWKEDLILAYQLVGGTPYADSGYPMSYGPISFIDTAKVARYVFERRK